MKRLLLDFVKRWSWAYVLGLFLQLILSFGCGYWLQEPVYLLSIPIGALLLPNMDRGIWRVIRGLPLSNQSIVHGLWFLVVVIESIITTLVATVGIWVGLALKSTHPEDLKLTAMLGFLLLNIGYRGTLCFALSLIQTPGSAKLWNQLLAGLGGAVMGLGVSAPMFWGLALLRERDFMRQWTPALIGLGLVLTIASYYRTPRILLGRTHVTGESDPNSGNRLSSEPLRVRPKLSAFPRLMVQSFGLSCSMALWFFFSITFTLWLIKGRPSHFSIENIGSGFSVGSLPYFQMAFMVRLATISPILTGIRHLRTLPISARRLSAVLVLLAVVSIIPFWLVPVLFNLLVFGTAPDLLLKWFCIFTGMFCIVQTAVLAGGFKWGICGALFSSALLMSVFGAIELKSPDLLNIPWWLSLAATGTLLGISHGLNERFLKKSSGIYLPRKSLSWLPQFGSTS